MGETVRLAACLSVFALAFIPCPVRSEERDRGSPASAEDTARAPRPRITISKETTYFTAPIGVDGCVDYCSAINQIAGAGVNRENNAAVLLWQASGPGEILENQLEAFCKSLQIPLLSPDGPYFVSFQDYVHGIKDSEEVLSWMPVEAVPEWDTFPAPEEFAWGQLDSAGERPWSAHQYPAVAGWLKTNERPLALVVEASRRSRMYSPLMRSPLLTCGVGYSPLVSGATRALVARAMLRLGSDNVEDAWVDLLAAQRLARLGGQGPTLVESFTALHAQGLACDGMAVLLTTAHLSPEQARRFQADLEGLTPMASPTEKVDVFERCLFLDVVHVVARDPAFPAEFAEILPGHQDTAAGILTRSLTKASIRMGAEYLVDWDDALRAGNEWYDRLVKAMREPTFRERSAAIVELHGEMRRLSDRFKTLVFRPAETTPASWSHVTFGRLAGEVGILLLLPALEAAVKVEGQGEARFAVTRVVAGLAACRADRGGYPRALAELRPRYLLEIPKDPFDGGEYRYRLRQNGYLLYSVGPNGKDDGGRNWNELVRKYPDSRQNDNVPSEADDVVLCAFEQGP